MRNECVVVLPFPPSVNHYWRRVGHRTIMSRAGREYRKRADIEIALQLLAQNGRVPRQPLAGSLLVLFELFPPDRRRRDLDNSNKAIADALQHAGVIVDDCQIDDWRIVRRAVNKTRYPAGAVVVTIKQLSVNERIEQ